MSRKVCPPPCRGMSTPLPTPIGNAQASSKNSYFFSKCCCHTTMCCERCSITKLLQPLLRILSAWKITRCKPEMWTAFECVFKIGDCYEQLLVRIAAKISVMRFQLTCDERAAIACASNF
mmetsp:Transcript_113826/g.178086  ORF Transcript_113826/g.178086 Transcript_113826/m.178086 type:complete len:120 (+) Transcript_113826:477-836(+)